ncbi:MAG: alpha/beta fold hydrolase [Ectothiorhodospiraceae bacterium]|nr:alpha/beta fold hydrolase [Ectothiorhodospiraceae bacterium]MCH8505072.1 alpha/beta hydrolase [Ectothiorhodospiraceae bacterium]
MPSHPLILIHGAWAGGWVWEGILPALRDAGLEPHAVDLPGNGSDDTPPEAVTLQLYVDTLRELLLNLPGKASLVAHSGGGVIATQLAEAEPDLIRSVVFIAGMMLPSGMGFAQLTTPLKEEDPTAAGIMPHLEWNASRSISRVPAAAARDIFFQDVPDEAAWAAARKLGPQPESGRAVQPRWTPERFGRIPRLYVEALEDRSVVLAAQRRMQSLVPGATVASLPTGHAPQLSAPQALTDAVIPFLKQH